VKGSGLFGGEYLLGVSDKVGMTYVEHMLQQHPRIGIVKVPPCLL
jgi:hypothetical protein